MGRLSSPVVQFPTAGVLRIMVMWVNPTKKRLHIVDVSRNVSSVHVGLLTSVSLVHRLIIGLFLCLVLVSGSTGRSWGKVWFPLKRGPKIVVSKYNEPRRNLKNYLLWYIIYKRIQTEKVSCYTDTISGSQRRHKEE